MSNGEYSNTQESMVLPLLQQKNIIGKPFITVSAKGIVNGLSRYPNDGADFGPDTTKGATAPGQYGGTYTETSGIQEGLNRSLSQISSTSAFLPEIHLSSGNFIIHKPITYMTENYPPYINNVNNAYAIYAPSIIGSGVGMGQANFTPNNTTITCASDFPAGEYAIAYIPPPNPYDSGAFAPSMEAFIIRNFTLMGNNLSAGICFLGAGSAYFGYMAIKNIIVPNPVITKGFSTTQQSYQTGAVVIAVASGASGEYTKIEWIQSRGGVHEDGFVIIGEQFDVENCWEADGAQRYGFNISTATGYPGQETLLFKNCQSDPGGGWTGSVPYDSPQSANWYLNVSSANYVTFLNCLTDTYAPPNSPYLFVYGGLVNWIGGIIGGSYNPVSGNAYAIQNNGILNIIGALLYINSSYYGLLSPVTLVDGNAFTSIENCSLTDGNTGAPAVNIINVNVISTVKTKNIIQNNSNYILSSKAEVQFGVYPKISPNPPVSGTVYQNTYTFDIRLKIPVTYSPTTTAAATLATGISTGSTVTTTTKVSIPAGVTAGEILTYDMVVPAGWDFELVVTNATIGTVEVQTA